MIITLSVWCDCLWLPSSTS